MARDFDPDLEGASSYPKDFDTPPGQVPQRSDEEIKSDLESILFYDDLVRSYEITIDVSQGVITLSGTVSNDVERLRAEDDAARVHGVKQVINNIAIGRQAGR